MNHTISAVVPVYKVPENYLRECIESILQQTYQDFQLILVDDGSPDDCGKICDEYAASDSRVLVIHQKNGGVSNARNAGLSYVTGRYLTFVDSDDLLVPDTWERAVYEMQKNNCQLACFGWVDFSANDTTNHQITDKIRTISWRDFQSEIASHDKHCSGGYPWNKVWDCSRIHEVQGTLPAYATDLDIYEDKLWVLMAAQEIGDVVLLPDNLYHYRYLSSSLTQDESQWSKRIYKSYGAYDMILDYLQSHNHEAYIQAYNFYYKFCLRDLRIITVDPQYTEQVEPTKRVLHKLCHRIKPRTLRLAMDTPEFKLWMKLHYTPIAMSYRLPEHFSLPLLLEE